MLQVDVALFSNLQKMYYWEYSVGVGNIFKVFRLILIAEGIILKIQMQDNFGITGNL